MGKVCFLCKSAEDDEVQYGKFYTKWKLSVHYYCLLLSSNLIQNGADDTVGIFGFLEQDIRKENERTKRYRCYACKDKHANVSCCFKKCLRVFHTECGFKNGCLSHYTGTYQSWCPLHIPLKKERKPHGPEDSCAICFDAMGPYDRIGSVRAPCCRNGWFHLRCVRQLALAAGYFLKCPLCNNVDEFTKAMPLRGVFVPERDAAWELEPNAFQEQLERPSECDAKRCRCRDGRTVNNRSWSLLICGCCGSTSRHRECLEQPGSKVYVCQQCKPIMGDRMPVPEGEEEEENDDDSTTSDTYASCESSEEEEIVALKRKNSASAGSESGVQCSSSEESVQPIRMRKRKPNQTRIASDSDSGPSEASSESIRRSTRSSVRRRAIKRLASDDSEPTVAHPEEEKQPTVLEETTTRRTKGKRQRQPSPVQPAVQQDEYSNSSGTSSLSICPRKRRCRQSKRKATDAIQERLLASLLSDTESITRDSSPAGSADWRPKRTAGATKKRRTVAEKKTTTSTIKRQPVAGNTSSSDSDSSLPILPVAKRRRRNEVSKAERRLRAVKSPVSDADEENINPQLGAPLEAALGSPPSPPSAPETVKPCTSGTSAPGSSTLNRSGQGEMHQTTILSFILGHSSSKTIPNEAGAGTSAGKDHSGASKLRSPTERSSHKKQLPTGQRDLLKFFNRC